MKHKVNKIRAKGLCVGLILLLLLTGCSAASRTASKATLEQDLVSSEAFHYFAQKPNTTVSGLEIIKRQTDADAKTDRVWVEVSLSNDMFKGKVPYIMDYVLYNDGWHLENVESDDASAWSFTALRGLTEEELLRQLPTGATILDVQTNLDAGTQYVDYERTESHALCDVTYTGTFEGHFNTYNEVDWFFYTHEVVDSEQWHPELELQNSNWGPYRVCEDGTVQYTTYDGQMVQRGTQNRILLEQYTADDFFAEYGWLHREAWDQHYQKRYTFNWGDLIWDNMRYGYQLGSWNWLLLGWDESYVCDLYAPFANHNTRSFDISCTPLQIVLPQ